MFTLVLAYINAKYDYNYELLFVVTFLIDISILDTIQKLFS